MSDFFLYGLAVLGFLFLILALFYASRIKKVFASISRLERPWLLLEIGIVCLFTSLLVRVIDSLGLTNSNWLRPVGNLFLVIAAFFILYAMVTMKRAWTITRSD